MSKEEYYNKIKNWVYGKLNELHVYENVKENCIYLHYENDERAQIKIVKDGGIVYYNYEFSEKIKKYIKLEHADFIILLKRWIEDTFQVKVYYAKWFSDYMRVKVDDTFQVKVNKAIHRPLTWLNSLKKPFN